MAGCTSNEAPVTDEGLWKDARPTGASLPYPRDTPTIIARHRTAGTSQQDDLGTAVVLAQAGPHAKEVHGVVVTPEMAETIAGQVRDV